MEWRGAGVERGEEAEGVGERTVSQNERGRLEGGDLGGTVAREVMTEAGGSEKPGVGWGVCVCVLGSGQGMSKGIYKAR